MVALIADNPLRRHVLNKLIHPGVLPDRADGNAAGAVEARVLHEQVRRVRLGRDRVVAPCHVPPAEGDVVRVEGVDAVCVLRRRLRYDVFASAREDKAKTTLPPAEGSLREQGRTLLLETERMVMSSMRTFCAVCTASVQNWLCTNRMPRIVKLVALRMTRLIGRPAMLLVPFAKSYLRHSIEQLQFRYRPGG